MNKRTEEKLKDLSGMSKAVSELLGQAWERGRKYGEKKEQTEVKGDLISRSELANHKFLSVDNPNVLEYYPETIKDYQRAWNDAIDAIIDNAPTVEYQNPTIIEEAIDILHDTGWIQRHDKELTKPTGKWNVISLLDGYVHLRCSECGHSTRLVRDAKNEFCCIKDVRDKIIACPYCGADMRGEKNE